MKKRVKTKTKESGSLLDGAQHLIREAEEEKDPFMRRLLLFTAAGIAASAAAKRKLEKE